MVTFFKLGVFGMLPLVVVYFTTIPREPVVQEAKREVLSFESQKISNLENKIQLLREKYTHLEKENESFEQSRSQNSRINELEEMIGALEMKNRILQQKILMRIQSSAHSMLPPTDEEPKEKPKKKRRRKPSLLKFYLNDGQVIVGRIYKDSKESLIILNPSTKNRFTVDRSSIVSIVPTSAN